MSANKLDNKDTNNINHELKQLVMSMIKQENPDWIAPNGTCAKCVEYYDNLDELVEIV